LPYLVLLNEDRSTTTLAVEASQARITLGSKSDNDLVAPIKGVSRHHAHIFRENGEYILEDLDSTNFIFVEQQQVDRCVLSHNTAFGLGDYAQILFLTELDDSNINSFVQKHAPQRDQQNTTRIFHQNLPKSVKELETLIEVGASISSSLDLDDVLNTILDKALTLMRAERGFIMLLEEGHLVPKIARNMGKDLMDDERYSFSRTFADKVIEKKSTLISTNVAEDPRYMSASIISHKILSIISAPLKTGDEAIGCLYVDVRQTTRYFSPKDSAFFSALANQASIAIQNARLAENLKKNQIFLEQTNTQLKRSLEQLTETNIKLERQRNELEALFEVSRSLNSATDTEDILQLCLMKTRKIIGAERVSLLMFDSKRGGYVVQRVDGRELDHENPVVLRSGEGIAGLAAKTGKGIIANAGATDPRFKSLVARDSNTRQVMSVPLMSGEGCAGLLNLVNSRSMDGFTKDDLNIASSIANLATLSIEKVRIERERMQQEKLNQEIEDAQKVQQLLLPKEMPTVANFEFSAKYALANRVGGDYYDFIPVDDNRLALVIADVSGHDIASALVMAMGRNLIRTLFDRYDSPAKILAHTSRVLREDTQSQRYITMFLGILDSKAMTLTYSNGGHNYPLYLPHDKDVFESLSVGGFPLGLLDDYEYSEASLSLDPGDFLILYTDGLIEAKSPSNEMFELDRLQNVVLDYRRRPIEEVTRTIYDRAVAFTEKEKLQDDFTFVAVRARPLSSELHFKILASPSAIEASIRRIMEVFHSEGMLGRGKENLVAMFKESLKNAIDHGCRNDRKKRVFVSVVPSAKRLAVTIRDEGEGFDRTETLQGKKDGRREQGRGLTIISEYADKVEWNEKGNVVRMIFNRTEMG